MIRPILACLTCLFLFACADPLNRVTADRYAQQCAQAEHAGNLAVAEQACARSLANVDLGNLSPAQKSEKLYNLARIKRRLAKHAQAERLLRQSLKIERALDVLRPARIGRRLAELSANLAGLGRWQVGVIPMSELIPIAHRFSGAERSYVLVLYREYAKNLPDDKKSSASVFRQGRRIESLGFESIMHDGVVAQDCVLSRLL